MSMAILHPTSGHLLGLLQHNIQAMLKAEMSQDRVHPNEQGYQVLSKLAKNVIASALKFDKAIST
jgi:lysophospholipase L1-like esterase